MKKLLKHIANLFDICIFFGGCNFAHNRGIDFYIELGEIRRKPSRTEGISTQYALSIFRIDIY